MISSKKRLNIYLNIKNIKNQLKYVICFKRETCSINPANPCAAAFYPVFKPNLKWL